jgi:hypothetical protein
MIYTFRLCPSAALYLVGTKADEVDKVVLKVPDLVRFATEMGAAAFKTTSSKAGTGVNDVFDDICNRIKGF